MLAYFGAALFGYLLGSVPFGLLLTHMAGLGDVRRLGSGNIGATNVLRTGHKGLAAVTLVLDALKGTAAILAVWHYGPEFGYIAGFFAFIGHIAPIWLKFKGGKGVATYLGVLIGIHWPVSLAFAISWLLVAAVTRYSSLAALVSMIVAPVAFVLMNLPEAAIMTTVMSVLVYFKHKTNIKRLLAGEETRIGSKG